MFPHVNPRFLTFDLGPTRSEEYRNVEVLHVVSPYLSLLTRVRRCRGSDGLSFTLQTKRPEKRLYGVVLRGDSSLKPSCP